MCAGRAVNESEGEISAGRKEGRKEGANSFCAIQQKWNVRVQQTISQHPTATGPATAGRQWLHETRHAPSQGARPVPDGVTCRCGRHPRLQRPPDRRPARHAPPPGIGDVVQRSRGKVAYFAEICIQITSISILLLSLSPSLYRYKC